MENTIKIHSESLNFGQTIVTLFTRKFSSSYFYQSYISFQFKTKVLHRLLVVHDNSLTITVDKNQHEIKQTPIALFTSISYKFSAK